LLSAVLVFAVTAWAQGTKSTAATSAPETEQATQPRSVRVVDLKASDGTILKASYFAAAKPGPRCVAAASDQRQRKVWDDLAGQLAAAGINTLTLDMRGHGESGGTSYNKLTDAEEGKVWGLAWRH
jgi:predicted acyl esterase